MESSKIICFKNQQIVEKESEITKWNESNFLDLSLTKNQLKIQRRYKINKPKSKSNRL